MAGSTLDPDNFPPKRGRKALKGHDVGALGPSDTSDSGQDVVDAGKNLGDREMDGTSDAEGTGEHLTAGPEPKVRANEDRGVDRVVGADEAGLGAGLDQAEEARLGVTDEELQEQARDGDDGRARRK